jgi:hypothetical protein
MKNDAIASRIVENEIAGQTGSTKKAGFITRL